jgi:formylglycine-generating enzyme required for sulfatase activity
VWHHARLHGDIGHTAPAGTAINTGLLLPGTPFDASGNWGVGAFVYRSTNGSGTFSPSGIELRWNYGTQVPAIVYEDIAEVKVFAIEMVYVPEGSFFVGTNGATGDTYKLKQGDAALAFPVTSEEAIVLGTGNGELWAQGTAAQNGLIAGTILSDDYPKGFRAFYVHKHEVTQQAYVDFLNTLTYTQQELRTATAPNSSPGTGALSSSNANRNGIEIQIAGVVTTTPALYACNLNSALPYGADDDGQWLPCNFTNVGDWMAYMDWSGLRLMTELEFEKACRGPLVPVNGEYAWGTNQIKGTSLGRYTFSGLGTATEGIATNYNTTGTAGNAIVNNSIATNFDGPVRVGIFAANVDNANNRVRSGASYYGILELTGNLWERTVNVGRADAQGYTGRHGDGTLNGAGAADVSNWPSTGIEGSNWKGGAYNGPDPEQAVSDRQVPIGDSFSIGRNAISGFRGVRTAQ